MVFGWFIVFLAVTNKTFDVTIEGLFKDICFFSLYVSKYIGVEVSGSGCRYG